MASIKTISNAEFSNQLGLADHMESDGELASPSPWGIARFIRREIRRRGLVTRRELRKVIEPYLAASGFDGDAAKMIRDVAERMVDVGELGDLKVENQRGYSAMPSRWIELNKNDAVLLGTTATERHRFSSFHPRQFLRRFRPSDQIVSDLEQIGVKQQSFDEWLGEPGWQDLVETQDRIDSLSDLLNWYLARLEEEGAPFSQRETKILAIENRPGEFFGVPWNSKGSRWKSPSELSDGIYLGGQPGHSERQWHPVLIKIARDESKSLMLNCRNNVTAVHELRNWLLIAIGVRLRKRETISLDKESSEIILTFPAPKQLGRCFDLAGEISRPWSYSVLDPIVFGKLLSAAFPDIEFKADYPSDKADFKM
jgi:hypothetical protein